MANDRAQKTRKWLTDQAIPLWTKRGVDWEQGGFVENLSMKGERLDGTKRTMVQARQIYSFCVAADIGVCPKAEAARMVAHSADFLVKNAFAPNGAAYHCLTREGAPHDEMADLYAQAFVMFGLANAYAMANKADYHAKALGILRYLERERGAAGGGFTEVKDGGIQYQSNPHMHLFEAALAWAETDSDPVWRRFADDLFHLCRDKFVDKSTGFLAEQFEANWEIKREGGRFVFEPGHQYEWAWLMVRYERITGSPIGNLARQLFANGEKFGISKDRGCAIDEVWSDETPKKKSARFWPQTERIKAAVRLGEMAAADEALDVLFRYLDTEVPGLWYDTWAEDGEFLAQPVKASSLYHIIGAMSEFMKTRS